MNKKSLLIFFSAFGLWQSPCFAIAEKFREEEDLRFVLGVGGIYEGINLDGSLFWGGGPEVEALLEFRLGRFSAFGFGARYRKLSALGPDPTSTSTSMIQVSNIDYLVYGKFSALHLLAGVENFSGNLILSGTNGSQTSENTFIPVFGLGTTVFAGKRLKGRIHALYSYGTVFGYAYSSVQLNFGLTVNLP